MNEQQIDSQGQISELLKESKKEPELLTNMIRCPDGTIIESRHRNDFVTHTQEDGRSYSVDGGSDYLKRIAPDDEYEDLSLTTETPIGTVREFFTWGTRGKECDQEPKYILLKDLSNGHVGALVDYTYDYNYPKKIHNLFKEELEYRKENNIYVEEVEFYE